MVNSINFLLLLSLLAFAPFCHGKKKIGGYLYPQFYDGSCPRAQEIVKSIVSKAVAKEPRMAASLLRLHFHDCFVKVIYDRNRIYSSVITLWSTNLAYVHVIEFRLMIHRHLRNIYTKFFEVAKYVPEFFITNISRKIWLTILSGVDSLWTTFFFPVAVLEYTHLIDIFYYFLSFLILLYYLYIGQVGVHEFFCRIHGSKCMTQGLILHSGLWCISVAR